MSDAVIIALSTLVFLLVVFFALLRKYPEELRKKIGTVETAKVGAKGIEVTFFETQANKAAERRGGRPPSVPQGRPFVGKSILWVDDRPENNLHEFAMFEALGADVRFARDNKSAVRIAQESAPDLLISDIGRGGSKDGLELSDAFRRKNLRLPPLIYYIENRRDPVTEEGHPVTIIPSELLSASAKALGGEAV
ncbi:MAG: hypothetical protein OXH76_01770 [Boseongicola sp.]|nr:hypothetical protein [Boseongicola sp.]